MNFRKNKKRPGHLNKKEETDSSEQKRMKQLSFFLVNKKSIK